MYKPTIDMHVKQQKLAQGDVSSVSHKNTLLAGRCKAKTWEDLWSNSDVGRSDRSGYSVARFAV